MELSRLCPRIEELQIQSCVQLSNEAISAVANVCSMFVLYWSMIFNLFDGINPRHVTWIKILCKNDEPRVMLRKPKTSSLFFFFKIVIMIMSQIFSPFVKDYVVPCTLKLCFLVFQMQTILHIVLVCINIVTVHKTV